MIGASTRGSGCVSKPDKHVLNYGLVHDIKKPMAVDCNTTACGIGLAAISNAFKDAGLSFKFFPQQNYMAFYVDGRSMEGTQAAAEIFNITPTNADMLFGGFGQEETTGKAAELELAARIREFVDTGQVPMYFA